MSKRFKKKRRSKKVVFKIKAMMDKPLKVGERRCRIHT